MFLNFTISNYNKRAHKIQHILFVCDIKLTFRQKLGRLLKEYKLKKDLSYEKLSTKLELMGISIHKQSLYNIENNKRNVKDYELFGIAYVLGIDVDDLLLDMRKNFKN